MQFPGKLMNQTLSLIWPIYPNLFPKSFFKDSTSNRCYKLLQAVIVRNFKEN